MKVKLLGLKNVDFKPDDGERLVGTSVFVGREYVGDKENIGMIPSKKIWIADGNKDICGIKLTDFIGKNIDVEYDDKGKAIYISAA